MLAMRAIDLACQLFAYPRAAPGPVAIMAMGWHDDNSFASVFGG